MVQVPISCSSNLDRNPQESKSRSTRRDRDPISSNSTSSSNSNSTDSTASTSNLSISTLIPTTSSDSSRDLFPSTASPTTLDDYQNVYPEQIQIQPQDADPLRFGLTSDDHLLLEPVLMKRENSNSSAYYSPTTELQEPDYSISNSNSNPNSSDSKQQAGGGGGSSLDRSSSLGSESVISTSSDSIHTNNYAYNSDSITSHSHSNSTSNSSDYSPNNNKLNRNLSTKSRTSGGDRIGSLKRSAIKQSANTPSSSNSSFSSNVNLKNIDVHSIEDDGLARSSSWTTNSTSHTSPDDYPEIPGEIQTSSMDSTKSGNRLSRNALEDLLAKDRRQQEEYQKEAERAVHSKKTGSTSDSTPKTQFRSESLQSREELLLQDGLGEEQLPSRISFENPPPRSSSRPSDLSITQTPKVMNRNSRSNTLASATSLALSSPSTNKNLPLPPVGSTNLPLSNASASSNSLLLSPNRNKPLPEPVGGISPPFVTPPDSADNSANQSRETLSAFSSVGVLGVGSSSGHRVSATPSLSVSPAVEDERGSAWPSPNLSSENSPLSNHGFRSAISRSGKAFKKWTGGNTLQSGTSMNLSPSASASARSPATSSGSAWSSQLNSPASRNSSRAPTPDPNESQASIGSRGSTADLGSVDSSGARISYGIAKGQVTPSIDERHQSSPPPRSHSPFGFFRPRSRTSNRTAGGLGLQKLTSSNDRQSSSADNFNSTGSFSRKQKFSKEKSSMGSQQDRASPQSSRPSNRFGLTSLSPARPTLESQNSSSSTNTINTNNTDASSTAESGGSGSGGSMSSAWNRFSASTVRERGKRASHRLSMSLLEAAATPLMSPNSVSLGLPSVSPEEEATSKTTPRASPESQVSPSLSRPALRRHRSKSVDHLQKVYAGNRAQEEIEPVAIAAAEASQKARVNSIGNGNRKSSFVNPEKLNLAASTEIPAQQLGLAVKDSRNSSGKSSIYTGRVGLDLEDEAESARGVISSEEIDKELGIVTRDSKYYSSLATSGSGTGSTWTKKLSSRRSSGIPSLIRPESQLIRESSKASSTSIPYTDHPHNAKAAFSRMTSSFRSRRTSSYGGNKISSLTPQDSATSQSSSGEGFSNLEGSRSSALSSKSRISNEQPDSPGLENLAAAAQLSSDLLALFDQEDEGVSSLPVNNKSSTSSGEVNAVVEGFGLERDEGTLRAAVPPSSRPASVTRSSHSKRASLGSTLSSLFEPVQPRGNPPSPKRGSFIEELGSPPAPISRPGTSLGFIRNIRRRSSMSSNADDVVTVDSAAQMPLPARAPASKSKLPIPKAAAALPTATLKKSSPPDTVKGHSRSNSSPLLNNSSPTLSISSPARKQVKSPSNKSITSSISASQVRSSSPASASPQRHPPSSYRGQARNGISGTGTATNSTPSGSVKSSGPSISKSSNSTSVSARERATDYSKSRSKRSANSTSPSRKAPLTSSSRNAKLGSNSTPMNLASQSAISDTEDDPLPPPRSSSRQGFARSKSEDALALTSAPPRSSKQRSRATSGGSSKAASSMGRSGSGGKKRRGSDRRPSLTLDTSVSSTLPPRPSTAQGMHRNNAVSAQSESSDRSQTSVSAGTTPQRKFSQQALSIVDDVEFLRALEQVRSLHKEQMAKQETEASKIERMAKLGMAPGNKRPHHPAGIQRGRTRQVTEGTSESSSIHSSNSTQAQVSGTKIRHARTSSADARLGGKSKIEAGAEFGLSGPSTSSNKDSLLAGSSTPDAKATAITLREELAAEMGQAAGNDEDWKKEVKALFVIRELVQTELSYQRYLESLLNAIRTASAPSSTHTSPIASRRKSGSGLSALTSASPSKASPSAATPAPHIRTLRNLLPQLIALSRSLTAKIDENPTPSGVGTAFKIVSPQLEATFVGWSSQIDSIMAGLRAAEGGKGRSRLGLIPILPIADFVESSASQDEPVPSSITPNGSRSNVKALSVTRPSSPTQVSKENVGSSRSIAKRRSTISNADHYEQILRSTTTDSPISTSGSSSNEAQKQVSKSTVPSRSTSPWGWASGSSSQPSSIGKKAGLAYKSTNASRNRSNNQSESPQESKGNLTSSSSSSTQIQTNSKALSVLDVAIMPTQRVPRYLLLLRDLVRNTPERSISHAIVQRALDELQRTAALCDQASSSVVNRPSQIPPPATSGIKSQRWNAWA